MRYQVPQFIDVEDKVFGPFTFRQFIYIAGGAGMCFVLLRILPKFFAIMAIIPVAAFSLGLAFYKVNNKPFVQLIEAWFKYVFSSRLYIWRRTPKSAPQAPITAEAYLRLQVPKMREGKLKDVQWSLDAKREEGSE